MSAPIENTSVDSTSAYHHGNLRQALIEAAEQEIGDKGLEAFSLRSVARRAGVSHNAPAHHFTDVQGLLTALATVGFHRLGAVQAEKMAAAPGDEAEQFLALGLGYIAFATENPALFRLMYSSNLPDRNNPDLAAAMRQTLEGLRLASPAQKDAHAGMEPMDVKTILAAWALVHGFADLANSSLMADFLTVAGCSQDEMARDVLTRLKIR